MRFANEELILMRPKGGGLHCAETGKEDAAALSRDPWATTLDGPFEEIAKGPGQS